MSPAADKRSCDQAEQISLYALRALPSSEMSGVKMHIAVCSDCRRELESLRPVVDSFALWPTDVLRSSESLWDRLASRIGAEVGTDPVRQVAPKYIEPDWEEVAPGICVKLLATDTENNLVSMLVRLAPGVEYPPHSHAGLEELHLLHGELWINERKLYPGDFNRAEPGTADTRVWSETGCTCVLITSPGDVLR
jgi:anti-sigma factor ChrR (cupin superfamily)